MAARLYPWNFGNNRVWGRVIPSRGLVHNIHFEENALEAFNPLLVWEHEPADAGASASLATFRCYRNGDLEASIVGDKRYAVAGLRPDTIVDYTVESVTPLEDAVSPPSQGFYLKVIGNRASISWDECTADDFGAYLLYWDAGAGGGTVDTLLETLSGSANTRTISPELTNGTTYQFALKFRDLIGNVS